MPGSSALTATNIREQKWAEYNPKLELLESKDVVNIREVSQIDKMFTINNALSVDLGGQTNSETVFGGRLVAGSGGQTDLHIGGDSVEGGRGIILLRSTALGGSVSRSFHSSRRGAIVTIPRTFADIVITEYGVAQLMGKSNRQRAEELISIAHRTSGPSFVGRRRGCCIRESTWTGKNRTLLLDVEPVMPTPPNPCSRPEPPSCHPQDKATHDLPRRCLLDMPEQINLILPAWGCYTRLRKGPQHRLRRYDHGLAEDYKAQAVLTGGSRGHGQVGRPGPHGNPSMPRLDSGCDSGASRGNWDTWTS